MAIKESSDELNPPVDVAKEALPLSRRPRTAADFLALAIATCGVGYLPVAPGTLGSLLGIGLSLTLRSFFFKTFSSLADQKHLDLLQVYYAIITLELLAILIVAMAGIWAATRAEKLSGKKDPGKVVIDEVAGQMVALAVVPMELHSAWTIVMAFFLFRLFDIVKPYPARRLESLEGGLGIMADDIVAGIYAAVLTGVMVTAGWLA
ncbi:MAG TPA: phosphatidylglycerophosphatase A [Pyrinomonadaceae bacterium]|nr:phosphatidylglycerophosphatase A [Pyrinomonadaceae bacterium]